MDYSPATSETTNKNMENLSNLIKLGEEEIKIYEKITEKTDENDILETNDGNDNQIKESSLISEHSYANLNNQLLNEKLSNDILHPSIVEQTRQNQNDYILKDDSVDMNNEISITEEIITIDGCTYQNEEYYNTNIKSINSENQISADDGLSNLCFIDKSTALGVLALQYDSSDAEDNNPNKLKRVPHSKIYRNMDETVLTSDDSTDSESDSTSSDSESDSESSISNKSSNDDSDNENKVKSKGDKQKKIFKQKGEFDDLPPIEDLKISMPEVLCDPLGEVAWMVEQMVVVRPKPGKPTLNLDTVLFIDKGQRALGHIFDVFGQVTEPHYCVRFNSSDHIRECDIKVGMTVYFCPNTEYTALVFLSEITKLKAIDDIEEGEAPQFSDDEEEQAYLNSLKNKANDNTKIKDSSSVIPNKRRRGNKSGGQSSHPWNSNYSHQEQNTHAQNQYAQNPRPFYRSHHPWSHHRYPQHNSWYQYNSLPNNHWIPPQSDRQHIRLLPVQWNSHYQWSQMNAMPYQGFPQTSVPPVVPPITIPPPPPPPPPPPNTNT